MSEFAPIVVKTPGGRAVRANVINSGHKVYQGGKTYIVPLLDNSGVHVTARIAQECVDEQSDCFILVTGKRSGGKSTCIVACASDVSDDFTAPQVAFRLKEFGEIFQKNPQGDGAKGIYPQVVMDEAGYAMYGPQWLKREQQIVAKELIVSRIKRQIIWMAFPIRKQLNPHVRNMAYMWIHVKQPKPFKRGYAIVRLAPDDQQSEFASELYWEPKYCFTFPEQTGPLWDEYEARKIDFVNEVAMEALEGEQGSEKDHAARNAILRVHYNYRKSKGDPITMKELGTIIGVNESRVSQILNP
jgi:hypothetical protein